MKIVKCFVLAGEMSGDILGSDLLRNLHLHAHSIGFKLVIQGIGGNHMESQGVTSIFPMSDLSNVGIFEIIPKIPLLLKRIRQTADAIIEMRPDIVITIDVPDFSFE